MDYDEFARVVGRFEIKNPPFPIKLSVQPDLSDPYARLVGPERAEIRFEVMLPDRDSGAMVNLVNVQTAMLRSMQDKKHVYDTLRYMLRNFIIHEIDEMIVIDGKRIFDPHAAQPAETRESMTQKPSPEKDAKDAAIVKRMGARAAQHEDDQMLDAIQMARHR